MLIWHTVLAVCGFTFVACGASLAQGRRGEAVLRVRAINDSGVPVEGVRLSLTPTASDLNSLSGITDAKGIYVFRVRASGAFELEALKVGYRRFVNYVTLRPGDSLSFELLLDPLPNPGVTVLPSIVSRGRPEDTVSILRESGFYDRRWSGKVGWPAFFYGDKIRGVFQLSDVDRQMKSHGLCLGNLYVDGLKMMVSPRRAGSPRSLRQPVDELGIVPQDIAGIETYSSEEIVPALLKMSKGDETHRRSAYFALATAHGCVTLIWLK